MYFEFKVKIPDITGKITQKKVNNAIVVHYEYGRIYNSEKQYNLPQRNVIGKVCNDNDAMMFPNQNYYKYFSDAEIPDLKDSSKRSSCLHVGNYIVVQKFVEEYKLAEMLQPILGRDSGLFLDLAAYSLISENNAGQYYPDYAYNHPLFTSDMRIYSDAKVCRFLKETTTDQSIEFLNEWNALRNHREQIYISYDSTNKNCQAGDIDVAEFGYSKDGRNYPIVNFAIAYDKANREPLFYEEYPGSIVDISQFQFTLEKTQAYGYKKIGFILDRGYFSGDNIKHMDKCGYDFIIMIKGKKSLVNELIIECKGRFEEDRGATIKGYHTNGITIKRTLFASDETDRYFHIYYSASLYSEERGRLENKIDKMNQTLEKLKGKQVRMPDNYTNYFDPIYYQEKDGREIFVGAAEKTDLISRELRSCGYFVIITSKRMTAKEALVLYKSRDASEKLFRGDKSYLGNKNFRVQSEEAMDSKIFIEFVALIIRNKIYTSLKDDVEKNDKKEKYMNVSAAIRELEKIEMVRQADMEYRQDHAVTATQKVILKALGIEVAYVKEKIEELNKKLNERK